ncbi:MAG: hypothetical protein CVV64_10415 [Candidatus Wallbacteria bacterium HGW-Wallbacteria-1]|jgi:type IV pilus assembly protein PilB|uniref:Type II secretion system protein GspE n=1 Tax=Candidatus Wallbacteria bacterium HGW-Wallbacteria-1 TaxID=2013854 RepID=A0A2N1PP80_9BACT|nr:MAG: hypothetical protein CVV64_10415 [Candidatus Wallbacteria bacterium HGW-Wallbacteria-1]
MLSEFIQKKRIGTLLLEKKLVTQEQLEWALIKQRESKCMLGEILVEAGFISEDTLCKMLALQFGVPFISESEINPSDELMATVPENLLKMKKFVPLKLDTANDILTIIIPDPNNFVLLDHVKNVLKYHVKYVLASSKAIERAVNAYLNKASRDDRTSSPAAAAARIEPASREKVSRRDIAALSEKEQDEAYGVNLVNSIVNYAFQEKAQEVHFEPLDGSFRIRFRIHGLLRDDIVVARGVEGQLVGRLKILAGLDFSEKRKPQKAMFNLEQGFDSFSCSIATLPGVNGEGAVLRFHGTLFDGKTLEDLGMDDPGRRMVRRFMMRNRGLAIVAGPHDSGKTVTMSAFLRVMDQAGRKNIVLQSCPGSTGTMAHHVQVDASAGDAVSVWRTAVEAASDLGVDTLLVDGSPYTLLEESLVPISRSGRGVVTSLATGASAADLLHDIVSSSSRSAALISALSLIIVERLIPVACSQCRKPLPAGAARVVFEEGGLNPAPFNQMNFVESKGCPACSHRSVTGRKAIFEVLEVNDDIRELLIRGASPQEIRKKSSERGMKTLKVQLLEKARRQEATLGTLVSGLVE